MKSNSLNVKPDRKESNLKYWLTKIPKNIQPTGIRLDFRRPVDYLENTGELEFQLDGDLSQKITGLANSEPFLIYCILMSALNIYLYKYKKAPCIVVGSPELKGKDGAPTGNNALAITGEIKDDCSFKELLVYIKDNLVEGYKNQDYCYDDLIKELAIDKTANKCPLFDVTLALKNIHHELPLLKNDIGISFNFEPGSLSGTISYNEALFYKGSIEQLLLHYTRVLKVVLQNPGILIADVSLISEEERQQLLFSLNDTGTDYPADKCIHQFFEEFAEKTPQAAALVQGTQKFSYSDLNNQANRLAHHLQNLGVQTNSVVGVFTDRSPEMITGLLAVLKAGGAYVPLDSSYPRDRMAEMVEIGDFKLIMTKLSLYNQLPKNDGTKVICLDYDTEKEKIAAESEENCVSGTTVNDLCYVIFTSGSTGVPKGACVYHKGWTNLLYWFTKEFEINPMDKNLIVSSFSFDLTQRAIAMSLINGGELHLVNADHYDPDLIIKTIAEESITLMNCAPSTFYPLIENKEEQGLQKLGSLRILFLGGEPISASRLKSWTQSEHCHAKVANVYGIAECADVSIAYVLKDYDRYIKSSVPAGTPIFNTQVYILDDDLKLVPKGVVGEICIAGDGLGKGYINDEALTAEKFVPNPFSRQPNEKLYRTGDFGRVLPDGNIEYLGRGDQQIKIRGYRIDIGDIETAVRQNSMIKEVVVAVKEFSREDRRLIAYLVKEQGSDNLTDEDVIKRMREFLNEKLPNYMVPNLFCVLDKLPLTPNGKIDRNALPIPGVSTAGKDETQIGEIEEVLIKTFADTLKVETVGVDDNFFQIGGYSLLVTQIVSIASQTFNVQLEQTDFLTNPTVKGFAQRIRENRSKVN